MSVCGIRLNMTSCAGVNATICISSVRESTSKRSAFDFTHSNRLCRWRHLLMLSEVILKAHAAHRHSRNLSFLYIIYHKYHFLPSGVYLCTILGYNVFVYFINRRNYLYNEKYLSGALVRYFRTTSYSIIIVYCSVCVNHFFVIFPGFFSFL